MKLSNLLVIVLALSFLVLPFGFSFSLELDDSGVYYVSDSLGYSYLAKLNAYVTGTSFGVNEYSFSNEGYFEEDYVFVTADSVFNLIFRINQNEECSLGGVDTLHIYDYHEVSVPLSSGINEFDLVCGGDSRMTFKVKKVDELVVPILDLRPISANDDFKVNFESPIGDFECVLEDGSSSIRKTFGESYEINYAMGLTNNFDYEFSEIYSFSDLIQSFNFDLICSKPGYVDFEHSWSVSYDNFFEVKELALNTSDNYFNLTDPKFGYSKTSNYITYDGDELYSENDVVELILDVGESSKLTYSVGYNSPDEKVLESSDGKYRVEVPLGYFLVSNDVYTSKNTLNFRIEDLAENYKEFSYKINYNSSGVEIITSATENRLYDDFYFVVKNALYESNDVNLVNVSNGEISADVSCEIDGVDFICFSDMSNFDSDSKINISFLHLRKEFSWIANKIDFNIEFKPYLYDGEDIPLYANLFTAKMSFNQSNYKNYVLKVFPVEDPSKEVLFPLSKQALQDSLDHSDRFTSSFMFEISDYDDRSLTFKFVFSNGIKTLYEVLKPIHVISDIAIDANLYVDKKQTQFTQSKSYDIFDEISSCGNGICEMEDCREDCFGFISEPGYVQDSYLSENKDIYFEHSEDYSLDGSFYKINVSYYDGVSNALDYFKSKNFIDVLIVDDKYAVFVDENGNYFWHSYNWVIEGKFANMDLVEEFVGKYEPSSKFFYDVENSNRYKYSVMISPHSFLGMEFDKILISLFETRTKENMTLVSGFNVDQYDALALESSSYEFLESSGNNFAFLKSSSPLGKNSEVFFTENYLGSVLSEN